MTIKVYVYSKRDKSTGQPGSLVTQDRITVTLKEPTDVLRPVFTITAGNWEGVGYNYISAVLGDKERFYRVESVVHVSNGLYEVTCVEDYLATWRAAILSSNQYIIRSDDSALYNDGINRNIIDMEYPAVGGAVFDADVEYNVFDTTNGYYVLGVIAGNVSTSLKRGPVRYIVMTEMQLSDLITELNNLTYSAADYNPLQYIVSCTYIPIKFKAADFTSHTTSWQLGSYTLPPIDYYSHSPINPDGVMQVALFNLTLPDNSYTSRGYGYNFAPWAQYHIYAGPFGDFDLPVTEVSGVTGRTISVEIAIDFCSGEGHLEIFSGTKPIFFLNTQVGTPVMLTQMTSNSMASQYAVASHLGASMSSAIGLNFGGSAREMGAAVMTSYEAAIPKVSSLGSNGSMANIYDDNFYLVATFNTPANEDLQRFGRPVMKSYTLSSVASGKYIKTAGATISIPGYASEIAEIENALNSGIYLE